MGNYHQKKREGKLPVFSGNEAWVTPIYGEKDTVAP